jgi:tetratricopeptide (TPR) repeat protein
MKTMPATRLVIALALGSLLAQAALAYINAGFRSEAEARAYYAKERAKLVQEMFARWDAALARNPDDAVPYYQRANFYLQTSDYAKAFADYNEALRRDSKLTKAYYRRSFLWARRNEFGKVVADLEEVLRLDSKHDRAHRQLALVYYRCPDERFRDLAKAKEHADRASELSATGSNHQLAAVISAELGDIEAAMAWIHKPTTNEGRGLGDGDQIAILKQGMVHREYHYWIDRALFGDSEEFRSDYVSLPAYR